MSKHLLLVALVLATPAAPHAHDNPPAVAWQKNYDAAMKAARQSAKPVLLDFWATWCKPCKEMDAREWPDPQVQQLAGRFLCVRLNLDRARSEARRFNVQVIPSVIIIDPWSNVLYRHDGYASAAELAAAMSAMPRDLSEIAELHTQLERDSNDSATLIRAGDFYNKHDILEVANSYYRRAFKTKVIEGDPATRENLLISVGVNNIRLKRYAEARKYFDTSFMTIPNGGQCANALLGVLITQVEEGKIGEAEKTLSQLRDRYPDSPATRQAEQHLDRSRRH